MWTPECMKPGIAGFKWRILADPINIPNRWFYIECKRDGTDDPWEGGIAGTSEFLGLTEEEIEKAYIKKK